MTAPAIQAHNVRRDVDRPCWIGTPTTSEMVEARLRNISEGGAKIVSASALHVQDQIFLFLTQDGKVGRRCRVAWRSDEAIGVMFLGKASLKIEAPVEI